MALDFSILTSQPSVVERFLAGQQEAQRNALAQQQLLHVQQQNALAKAQMQEYVRGREEQNALRTAIPADFDPLNPAHQAAAYRAAPTLAPGFIEKAILTRKTAGEIKEKDVKTQAEQFKLQADKLTHGLNSLTSASTPEAARAAIEEGVALGHFDRATADRQLATLPTDPRGYAKWRTEKLLALVDAKDRFAASQPKFEKRTDNRTEWLEDINPNSPTFGQRSSLAEMKKAPSLLTPQEEQQQIRIAQASRAPEAPTITTVVDPKNPDRMLTVDARRYKGGTFGDPGVLGVGGKEPSAALRTNKIEQGKSAVSDVIDSIRGEYQKLNAAEAIPSTQRSMLSNLASSAQASGLGQILGRATGTEEQASRDVIKSSRLMLLNAIKQATGMGAAQLNSNVELQTWLDAVSNPKQSIETVDQILDNIEKFVGSGGKYSTRKSGGAVTPAAKAAPAGGRGTAPAAAPAMAPMYAVNPETNERIMSTDGGQTWAPAR